MAGLEVFEVLRAQLDIINKSLKNILLDARECFYWE